MEASTQHFTAQDWAEHAQFVQMFRAAKQRKREWQAKMEATLAEKAEKIRRRRERISAYERSLQELEEGRVYEAKDVDDLFKQCLG